MPKLVYKPQSLTADTKYCVGSIIELQSKKYRIVVYNSEYVITIQMDITKYRIYTYRSALFGQLILTGEVRLVPEQPIAHNPVELMSESDQEAMNYRVDLLQKMLQEIYPDYEILQRRTPCAAFSNFQNAIGVSIPQAHKLIRAYLQSGLDPYAIADKRKNRLSKAPAEFDISQIKQKKREGEPLTANELECLFFNEVCERFEESRGKHQTLAEAYDDCVIKYYSNIVHTPEGHKVVPKDDRPSYDRTRRYVLSHTGLPSIRHGYISESDYRNDHRLLTGNAKYGVASVCEVCEMDECATDLALVSQYDRTQILHRVVMYILIDVRTTTIIGCWPDLQDNSVVGATNCFLTLCEEHNAQTSKYEVATNNDIFPSMVLPHILRCDHGAEYMSKEFKRFCVECGITVDPVAPASGSLKGYVEQCFHQFHSLIKGAAMDKGYIIKDSSSNHYKTACADINDARKICFEFVNWFNQHLRSDEYPLSVAQIQARIPAIPWRLWQFECSEYDTPKRITEANRDQFLYSMLLTDEQFRISRKGITCHGRYYFCDEPWLIERMRECDKKTKLIDCRYDPRTAEAIYMLVDKKLKRIPLAVKREEQCELANMTWSEANALAELKKQTNAQYKEEDYARRLTAKLIVADVLEEARRIQGGITSKKDGMRESVKVEKQRLAYDNRIENKVVSPDNEPPINNEPSSEQESKKTDADMIISMTDDDDNPFI